MSKVWNVEWFLPTSTKYYRHQIFYLFKSFSIKTKIILTISRFNRYINSVKNIKFSEEFKEKLRYKEIKYDDQKVTNGQKVP